MSFTFLDKHYESKYGQLDSKLLSYQILDELIKKSDNYEFLLMSLRVERSQFQNASLIRHLFECRTIADTIIDKDGKLNKDKLKEIIKDVKKNIYNISSNLEIDGLYRKYMCFQLETLNGNDKILKILYSINISSNLGNLIPILQGSLSVEQSTKMYITISEFRKSIIVSYLFSLKQIVGSCFSTAPSIRVKEMTPELFFLDLKSILEKKILYRIVNGEEFQVLFSYSIGSSIVNTIIYLDFSKNSIIDIAFSPLIINILVKNKILSIDNTYGDNVIEFTKLLKENFITSQYVSIDKIISILLNLKKGSIEEKKITLGSYNVQKLKNKIKINDKFSLFRNIILYTECPLLRVWEYTLASLTINGANYTKTQLFYTFGFSFDFDYGIGQIIFDYTEKSLKNNNDTMNALIAYYNTAISSNDKYRAQEISIEIDALKSENEILSFIVNDIINKYIDSLESYFQYIYNPDLVADNPMMEDMFAGFSLYFKNQSILNAYGWDKINNADEFLNSLKEYISIIEIKLLSVQSIKIIHVFIKNLTTHVFQSIMSKKFLTNALLRFAKLNKLSIPENMLENFKTLDFLKSMKKLPWEFTFGGNVHSFLQTYYEKRNIPKYFDKKINDLDELFLFIQDAYNEISIKKYDLIDDDFLSYIMYSPTHVFLFRPKLKYLYSLASNNLINLNFIKSYKKISSEFYVKNKFTISSLMRLLKNNNIAKYLNFIDVNLHDKLLSFDEILNILLQIKEIDKKEVKKIFLEFIVNHLPFIKPLQILDLIEKIFIKLNIEISSKVRKKISQWIYKKLENILYGKKEIIIIIKNILLLYFEKNSLSIDINSLIIDEINEHFQIPLPIIFADTNWVNKYFTIYFSPLDNKLLLWISDYKGYDLRIYKSKWFEDKNKWGIFTDLP